MTSYSQEREPAAITFENPAVPFAADIPAGIFPGKAILIKGVVIDNSNEFRFVVDLCCGQLVNGDHQDDKALHFNPRFDNSAAWFFKLDRDIVMNSLINNTWGPEQRAQNVFAIGRTFSIRILLLKDYFKITVNGKQLCDYIHRVPLDTIKCLYINGCVQLSLIEFQGNNLNDLSNPLPSAPPASFGDFDEPISIRKPNVPFVQKLYGGFMPPRELHIIFTPKMSAEKIVFNFFVGTENLLHVRVDFPAITSDKKGAIVRNSTKKGIWQTEERRLSNFPFLHGITADIRFVAESDHVNIIIDGVLLDHFVYRQGEGCVRPLQVDQFTVLGDLSIQKFELKTIKN